MEYGEEAIDVYTGSEGGPKIKKLYLSLPGDDEGWIAGVYLHNDNYDVNKDPDCIDMMKDDLIKEKSNAGELDLEYMLDRIKNVLYGDYTGIRIVVHVLTCREGGQPSTGYA